jgi:hypothetical protein
MSVLVIGGAYVEFYMSAIIMHWYILLCISDCNTSYVATQSVTIGKCPSVFRHLVTEDHRSSF